jgi:DME family drug/metabolite transporter
VIGVVVLAAGLALLAWGSRSRDPRPFAVEA